MGDLVEVSEIGVGREVAHGRLRAGGRRGDRNRYHAFVRDVQVGRRNEAVVVGEPAERVGRNARDRHAVDDHVLRDRDGPDRDGLVGVELVAVDPPGVLGGVLEVRSRRARVEHGLSDTSACGDRGARELVRELDRGGVGERDLPEAKAGDAVVLVPRHHGKDAVGVKDDRDGVRQRVVAGAGVAGDDVVVAVKIQLGAILVPVVLHGRGVGGHVGSARVERRGGPLQGGARRRVVLRPGRGTQDRRDVRDGNDELHRLGVDFVAGELERDVLVAVKRREPVLVVGDALGDAERGGGVHGAGRGVVHDGEVDRVREVVPEVEVERRAVPEVGLGDDDVVHDFASLCLAKLDVIRGNDLDLDILRRHLRTIDRA